MAGQTHTKLNKLVKEAKGIDTITDFESSSDRLDVSASGFGGDLTANAFLEDFRFVLGNTALDEDDRFIYNNTTKSDRPV